MLIDKNIVIKYLNSEDEEYITNHWVFNNIEEGKYLFEKPSIKKKNDIRELLLNIESKLLDFVPLNKEIYSSLYPNWREVLKDVNIILVVGCPNPYDAMVREYKKKEYIIFDLIRFNDYKELGYDIDFVIKQLITHELSHLCLHEKYPPFDYISFKEKLKYIVFDEGFAHILAFKEDLENYDFTEIIKEHYENSLSKLRKSLKEKDINKQKKLLIESNSGKYWNKFGAVAGKLFIAENIKNINELYKSGIENFISEMDIL